MRGREKRVTRQDVSTVVTDIIVEHLGCDRSKVVPEARLIDDLGADSLDQTELILLLEETFDVDIDGRGRKIRRVDDLFRCIEAHLGDYGSDAPQTTSGDASATPT